MADDKASLPPESRPAIFDRLGPKDRGYLTKAIKHNQEQKEKAENMSATEQT